MLAAPARFGNLIHDSFLIFPEVKANDWGKKLFLRMIGAAFLCFAARFAVGIGRLVHDFR